MLAGPFFRLSMATLHRSFLIFYYYYSCYYLISLKSNDKPIVGV